MPIVRPKFFWPLTITSFNRQLVVNNGTSDATCLIALGTYVGPAAFIAAVEAAVAAHCPGIKCDYTIQNNQYPLSDRSGRILFRWASPFTIKAGDVASTAYLLLGFNALTYVAAELGDVWTQAGVRSDPYKVLAPRQHQNGWYPEVPPRSDSLDVRDRGMSVNTRAVAGQTKHIAEAEVKERVWRFAWLKPEKTYISFEASGTRGNEAVENMWASGMTRFRYFPNEENDSNGLDYQMTQDALRRFAPTRQFVNKGLYEYELEAWSYTP